VLFLDELPEFDRRVLEALREPLESGHITISRAARREFPARFQLVAAMNPCPCGFHGHPDGRCRCTPEQIARYRGKLSGPLLDRIDLLLEVPMLPVADLQTAPGEASAPVRSGSPAAGRSSWRARASPTPASPAPRSRRGASPTQPAANCCKAPSSASACRPAATIGS
jgi:magnesium chelatase family protein